MGEPRLMDDLHCNGNSNPWCQVYELDTEPNPHSLTVLKLNYFLQVIVVALSAGAGFTSKEQEPDSLTAVTLVLLVYIDFLFFFLPSLYLMITNLWGLHIFPRISIWLIERFLPDMMWVVYSASIASLTIALFTTKK